MLAVKYDKGVMIAADTLASYGSLARYKDMKRIIKVGDRTILGASGVHFFFLMFQILFLIFLVVIFSFNKLINFSKAK